MREYLLYVKVGDEAAHVYVTPCFAVDQTYWRERDGCRLHVIGKSPSLALAFYLRGVLNARLQGRDVGEEDIAAMREWALEHVREANALYGREARDMQPLRGEWFLFERAGEDAGDADGRQADEGEDADAGREAPFGPGAPFPAGALPDLRADSERLHLLLQGRALLLEELDGFLHRRGWTGSLRRECLQWLVLDGKAEWRPGIELFVRWDWWRRRLAMRCGRCGSERGIALTLCHTCGQGCAYCTTCLDMGRSKCCTPYLCVPGKRTRFRKDSAAAVLQWEGRYSPMQAAAAERARRFVAASKPGPSAFLMWAVCGAGKTELLFPAIRETLADGGPVLIATPRKDVVLELAPRLQRVFPAARVIAVHGSSREKWEDADITVATTHQVMRYYQRFPLVVLDEADAFPYHNNPVLYRAVSRAVQPGGKTLYLSATPPRYLRKRLVPSAFRFPAHSATHVLLPGRYHGFPLPVPRVCTVAALDKRMRQGRPVPPLLDGVKASLAAGRQVFVFVPRVEDVPRVLQYLQARLPDHANAMAGVHAADPEREQKVRLFRDKRHAVMVTTTILERGVTIPRSDVIVVGADAPVFDEASLVQIAGRVGRSADAPEGTVLFIQSHRSTAPYAAIRQIRRMNRLAERLRKKEAPSCCGSRV
ncbi:DEAD/DEAH box helicase [Brevibacillus thermoruber]|uniref:DEAD/DEAH box helicase n=1 Tax=Brevibacillus thermoruber TaxID=33942 RepID=UPI00041CCC2D|nr:DEAD/DEAH box helicase [Brevibacillus thermoruber]